MSSETKGQVENLLAELGKKIDHLIVEAKEAGGEIREDLEEKIQDLKSKKEKIEQDFEEYKSSEKWQDAKNHVNSAVKELKAAVEALFKDKK